MAGLSTAKERLAAIPQMTVLADAPLAGYTRFQIGGPAALLCDTRTPSAFLKALRTVAALGMPRFILGGGTNLVVSDAGFDGVVLRYRGSRAERTGLMLRLEAGATLQYVVDYSIRLGLKGLETLTGIPGYVGGAIYGNAGAYGHSINELVERVEITDGETVRTLSNAECRFGYRESIFKQRKDWIILSVDLRFEQGEREALAKTAQDIRTIRDAKYPPSMRCAGSIFKNLFLADLPAKVQAEVPAHVVRDGKVPSAWFLEQTGVKGLRRGDIEVAPYHANLVYNCGNGNASDLAAVIEELKQRVAARFGFELEEEVQYVGFAYADAPASL